MHAYIRVQGYRLDLDDEASPVLRPVFGRPQPPRNSDRCEAFLFLFYSRAPLGRNVWATPTSTQQRQVAGHSLFASWFRGFGTPC